MAKTRSKPAAKSLDESTEQVSKRPALPPSELNPPKLFILPKNASKEARILSLPNPATSKGNRYYFCPETGLYEFVTIAAPTSTPRSLLFASHGQTSKELGNGTAENASDAKDTEVVEEEKSFTNGYVSSSATLFVATPVDTLFFLLPILSPVANQKKEKSMFLAFEDYLESTSEQIKRLLKPTRSRELFEKRLQAICDTVEAGDETMFRLSVEKLVGELLGKAKRMAQKGLPASMEDRFVQQALQAPVLTVKREPTTLSETLIGTNTEEDSQPITADSQNSIISDKPSTKHSQDTVVSETSITTDITSISITEATTTDIAQPDEVPESIQHLLRIRTAINFMLTSYLPPHLRLLVQKTLSTNKPLDFSTLDIHLSKLTSLREEARALRSLSDNISRKRPLEDDEAIEARTEKKRKKEEEDKRKKMESRGAKQLKKVDTSGMKKMSSFFTKAPKT